MEDLHEGGPVNQGIRLADLIGADRVAELAVERAAQRSRVAHIRAALLRGEVVTISPRVVDSPTEE